MSDWMSQVWRSPNFGSDFLNIWHQIQLSIVRESIQVWQLPHLDMISSKFLPNLVRESVKFGSSQTLGENLAGFCNCQPHERIWQFLQFANPFTRTISFPNCGDSPQMTGFSYYAWNVQNMTGFFFIILKIDLQQFLTMQKSSNKRHWNNMRSKIYM